MILIIDCSSKKTPAIAACIIDVYPEHRIIGMNDFTNTDLETAKGIIISGAPILLSQMDVEPIKERFSFLKEITIPVLGICFGHQVLGLVYGANVFMGKAIRENIDIKILNPTELFLGLGTISEFCQDHTEGVSLPDGFLHLATSADYEVESFKHPSKPLWGVQFHPEVSGENGKLLLNNFTSIVQNAK
jgi:GMP synthase (glutamine-hydrolysing)